MGFLDNTGLSRFWDGVKSKIYSSAFGFGVTISSTMASSSSHYDLDDAGPGRYTCGLSNAAYVDHKPDIGSNAGFTLLCVQLSSASGRYVQFFWYSYGLEAGIFYTRMKGSSGWSEWYRYIGDVYPYALSNSELQRKVTATNLIKTLRYAVLSKGVGITPKADGTYSLVGTSTAGFSVPKIVQFKDIPSSYVGSTLKLTGGISSNISLRVYTNTTGSTYSYEDTGSGVEFTLTQAMLDTPYDIRLYVKSGIDCSNVVIRPMLCLAANPDSTFVPYIFTNEELAKKMARFDVSKMTLGNYIACGDSIVEYQGTTGHPHATKNFRYGYIEAIEDDYGLTCTNLGNAGHTILDDISTLLAVDYSGASLVTIGYGVNDARLNADLGDVTDVYDSSAPTFCGAMNALLSKIYTDNNLCNVIVLAPIQRAFTNNFGSFTPNANGKTLEDFADACVAVAGRNATPCVDMFHVSGINSATYSSLLSDGVHPNSTGYKRMYAAMRSTLSNLVMPKD